MNPSAIQYAWAGDSSIAYQVLGSGPIDVFYMQGFLSNVELNWEHPGLSRFLHQLARFSRLTVFDRRGLGCSERFTPNDAPPIENLMEDVSAVMHSVKADRPVLFATGDCAFIAMLFAATYPGHLSALVLYACTPTWRKSEQIPWGLTEAELEESNRKIRDHLGSGLWYQEANPSIRSDPREVAWGGRYERLSITPGTIYPEVERFAQIDLRGALPAIQTPTLVLHRTGDTREDIRSGRYVASQIRTAQFVELPGDDHFPWIGDQDTVVREVDGFLGTIREEEASFDRVLATVLFTDIIKSTNTAASLGDRDWIELLKKHHKIIRSLLARYKGREVETTGDGFLAAFDGPVRAVRCAQEAIAAVRSIGLEIRAGCHIGEVEFTGQSVHGITVNIAARIAALAGASEVLVSRTVTDLVAGSGLRFTEHGTYELKGVPGEWQLFLVNTPTQFLYPHEDRR
jgi:class 3 adenylate cyclase/pimeloyl-ACP methyl ester carboxylesterase